MTTSVHAVVGTRCWCCGADGASRRRRPDGRYWREPMCDACRNAAKRNGFPMEDTPAEARIKELEAEIAGLRGANARLDGQKEGA